MNKVDTKLVRNLISSCNNEKINHTLTGCADYIDELEKKISLLENSLNDYKKESDKFETSTHIDNFLYEMDVNDKGEIPCLIKIHGIEHTLGITERDAKSFVHLFHMHKK